MVVLEVNGSPGWQALQSVGDQDLTQLRRERLRGAGIPGLTPAPVTE